VITVDNRRPGTLDAKDFQSLPSAAAITFSRVLAACALASYSPRYIGNFGEGNRRHSPSSSVQPPAGEFGVKRRTPPPNKPQHLCTAHIERGRRSLGCSALALLPLYSVCDVLVRDCRPIVGAPVDRNAAALVVLVVLVRSEGGGVFSSVESAPLTHATGSKCLNFLKLWDYSGAHPHCLRHVTRPERNRLLSTC